MVTTGINDYHSISAHRVIASCYYMNFLGATYPKFVNKHTFLHCESYILHIVIIISNKMGVSQLLGKGEWLGYPNGFFGCTACG